MKKEDIAICTNELCSDLSRIWASLKKALPWLLGIYLVIVILVSLISITSFRGTVVGQLKSLNAVSIYWELMNYFIFVNWVLGIVFAPMVLIWGILCFCVYILICFLIVLCHHLFFSDSSKWQSGKVRYYKVVNSWVRHRVNPIEYVIFALAATFLIITLPPIIDSHMKIIHLCINLFIVLVPVVFAYVWFFYLAVRRTRVKTRRFDYYFFSKQAIKDKLSTIISLLVFIALLGNVFIPGLFIGLCKTINFGPKLMLENLEYAQKYQILVEDGYTSSKERSIVNLPPPHEMMNYTWHLLDLDDNFKPKVLIKQFQQGMFFVVTIACFFLVAIPGFGNAIVYRERRDGLKKIIWSTVSSMIIVGSLHFCIKKAYFIDTSKIVGMVTLFLFVISLSLSHFSIDPLKSKSK